MEKEKNIEKLVEEMLEWSIPRIKKKIKAAIESGAIDIESWDENYNPMVLPKCIISAALEEEAESYKGIGTSYERSNKKTIKNIRNFL